ncbi:MAG: hypothetical protein AAFX92_21065 [Pseudomonadota bacterium]
MSVVKALPLCLAIGALIGAPATAQQLPSCGSFQITLELDHIEFFDDRDEGPSAGDRRIGRFDTFLMDGTPAGAFLFASTTLPGGEPGDYHEFGHARYTFDHGTIHISTLYTLADPSDTEHTVTTDYTYPVLGGTGAFAGARGTVHTEATEAGRLHTFDLDCDEQDE